MPPTGEAARHTTPITTAAIHLWSLPAMLVLRDNIAIAAITDPVLRQLIERRIREISECCPWDADELGPIIVVEPGDTADALQAIMNFSILEGSFDDSRFGDDNFSPSFEFAEAHGDHLYELVYVVSDSGYGYDIFIANHPGIDPTILAFCQTYAVPTP